MGSKEEWRVKSGGLFHQRRTTYCPETHAILKELLRESKLTMMQRAAMTNRAARGEPLPPPPPIRKYRRGNYDGSDKKSLDDIIILKPCPRRRTRITIEKSGDLDPPAPPPHTAKFDYAKEKFRLQRIMAFGKTHPESDELIKSSSDKDKKEFSKQQVFQHLLDEIKERQDFMDEMESLGQGKIYKTQIKREIADKLKLMKEWDGILSDKNDNK